MSVNISVTDLQMGETVTDFWAVLVSCMTKKMSFCGIPNWLS
jgi:hypothetical protein